MDTIDLQLEFRISGPILMVCLVSSVRWSSRGFTVASPSFDRSTAIWISLVFPTVTKRTERLCQFRSIQISQTTKSCRFNNRWLRYFRESH